MMKEGYAGADQIAVHVSNTMGWKVMREGSVSDDVWNEIAAIYVKDKLGLSLRPWFETQNPFAFQDMSEVLLESSRKGLWKAEPGLLREVAEQYARSVLRHGEGGGLRGGGNQSLEQFVAATLQSANSAEMDQLAAEYQKAAGLSRIDAPQASSHSAPDMPAPAPNMPARDQAPSADGRREGTAPPAGAEAKPEAAVAVYAQKLEPVSAAGAAGTPGGEPADQPPGQPVLQVASRWPMGLAIAAICVLFLVAGFCFRRGLP